MSRWLKHVWLTTLLLAAGGCAGSCSSCEGCGVTPLPAGFPQEERVENATAVRLTQGGLKFISNNIAPLAGKLIGDSGNANAGVITFDIPSSSQNVTVGKINICPAGPKPNANPPECVVEADLGQANIQLETAGPNLLRTRSGSTLAVRLRKLPLKGSGLLGWLNSELALVKGADCSTRDYADIPVTLEVALTVDKDPTHGARRGYTKLQINKVEISESGLKAALKACGSGLDDGIINALKDVLAGQIMGPLTGTLKDTVAEQLCTSEDPAAGVLCPPGSHPDADHVCRFCQDANPQGICPNSNAECVGTALGIDGNLDLSSALASISPGTKGGFNFIAALGGEGARDNTPGQSWGDLDPVGGGATIGMLGGVQPTPLARCVPLANLQRPSGIPMPDEMRANTVSNWPDDPATPEADTNHLGISVNEQYLNFLLGSVYNSGALCLGVGSELFGSMLNSNTISLLIKSFGDLGRQKKGQPLALVIRPQLPPAITVGNGTSIETDPLLKLQLDKFFIDFYVFSSDRFIRAFTASFDVTVPVNLDVTSSGALAPVIDKLAVLNPKLTNADLIRENPDVAAKALGDIVAGQIGSALGGAIDPIDVSEQLADLGLRLIIPPTVEGQGSAGLRRLEKDGHAFLGIFAQLGVLPPGSPRMLFPETETDVSLVSKTVLAEGLSVDTLTADNRPKLHLRFSSPQDTGARAIEYSWRLDGGFWHVWSPAREVVVSEPTLSLQAKHVVEVRSREVGNPESVDRTPARLEVLIDRSGPEIELGREAAEGKLAISVWDVVSSDEQVKVRVGFDDAPFGQWVAASELTEVTLEPTASLLRVEAVDEEGNVATATQALIRGRVDASLAADSGCSCTVPGSSSSSGSGAAGLAALVALGAAVGLRRRQQRRQAGAGAASSEAEPSSDEEPAPATARTSSHRRLAHRAKVLGGFLGMTLIATLSGGCSCSDEGETSSPGTGGSGGATNHDACPNLDTGDCELLEPGLVGAYASAAVAPDGSVWVAAYNDFGYGTSETYGSNEYLWGDLVVGKLTDGKVAWKTVDGLPDDGEAPDPTLYDLNGFRGGYTEPGADVGLWTSLQVDASGGLHVAYWDATNAALRYARSTDSGATWSTHSVQQAARKDLGRYAKLLLVDGKPVIAFVAIEADTDGKAKSIVRIATASSAAPSGSSDWSFADAAVETGHPCRASLCESSAACVVETGVCTPTSKDCDKCGSGEKCVDQGGASSCQVVAVASPVEAYPDSVLYLSLAKTAGGLALVYYDRVHGNLRGVSSSGSTWGQPFTIDGQDDSNPAKPVDTGDVGLGASLAVDSAGDWHVAYVSGIDESLKYAVLRAGALPAQISVVDDGVRADSQAVVGDDTSIYLAGSEVRIAYQDATNGLLQYASGSPGAWSVRTLETPAGGFSGAFSKILDVGGKVQVMTWRRVAKPRTEGDVLFLTP